MNNNNIYSLPQKKPLSQSNIFAENNHLRLQSTHMPSRNNSRQMYSSSIFMKTSSLMNQQSQQSFLQPRQPLSPHYPKQQVNNSIQYIPPYNNIIPPMRQPESNYYPVALSKDVLMERALTELRQKMDSVEKRLQIQDRRGLNDGINRKGYMIGKDGDSVLSMIQIEDNVINSDRLKQLITSMFQQRIQSYTKTISQKLNQLQQTLIFPLHTAYTQKLLRLQQSLLRPQSQKLHEQQLTNRIKTIEKTIRQMGEDIHLVNDKEESLGQRLDGELKKVKEWERKWVEVEEGNVEVRGMLGELVKRVKAVQSSLTESNIMSKLKQVQSRLQSMSPANATQPQILKSFEKYPSQPIILKYLQKFQIIHKKTQPPYQQVTIGQMTYYIDEEGYLLDSDSFYLVNKQKGERVRLSGEHLQLLKASNILI